MASAVNMRGEPHIEFKALASALERAATWSKPLDLRAPASVVVERGMHR
jgi:hypothetical protein